MKRYPSWVAGLHVAGRGRYCLGNLAPGSQVTLRREEDNPHDEDAVAVTFRRRVIGYIPRKHHWIAHALDEGHDIAAHVDRIESGGWWLWKHARFVGLVIEVR